MPWRWVDQLGVYHERWLEIWAIDQCWVTVPIWQRRSLWISMRCIPWSRFQWKWCAWTTTYRPCKGEFQKLISSCNRNIIIFAKSNWRIFQEFNLQIRFIGGIWHCKLTKKFGERRKVENTFFYRLFVHYLSHLFRLRVTTMRPRVFCQCLD